MLSRVRKTLNPAVGFFRHCGRYLLSKSSDHFYPNPNFIPASEDIKSIYCVHGTADRSGAFELVKDKMLARLPANISGIYLLAFDNRLKGVSIKEFSRQLHEKIKANQDKKVILMGHSRGALVSAWFAENLAATADIQVDVVISVCGPFKGSPVALAPLAAASDSVHEMRLDSDFLQELTPLVLASQVRYAFVGASSDCLVWHDDWHPYENGTRNERFLYHDSHAHLSILTSNVLVDWMLTHLNPEAPILAEVLPATEVEVVEFEALILTEQQEHDLDEASKAARRISL
jgi:pimeloyl-ACP methyl ester carboxylesterase